MEKGEIPNKSRKEKNIVFLFEGASWFDVAFGVVFFLSSIFSTAFCDASFKKKNFLIVILGVASDEFRGIRIGF